MRGLTIARRNNARGLKSALLLFGQTNSILNIRSILYSCETAFEGEVRQMSTMLAGRSTAGLNSRVTRAETVRIYSINRAIATTLPQKSRFTDFFWEGKSYPRFFSRNFSMLSICTQCYPSGLRARSAQHMSLEIRVHARHISVYI